MQKADEADTALDAMLTDAGVVGDVAGNGAGDAITGRSNILWQLAIAKVTAMILLCARYPPIQQLADAQVDAGLKRAVVSFASARTLNAIVSVVQGVEMSVQPFGIGLTLMPGQVLDPVSRWVEQFLIFMLIASVAFGIQKMLLAIGGNWAVSAPDHHSADPALGAVSAQIWFTFLNRRWAFGPCSNSAIARNSRPPSSE